MNGRRLLAAQLSLFALGQAAFGREVAITIDDLPRAGDIDTTPQADREMTVKLLEPFRRGHIPLIGFVNECRHTAELRPLLSLWVEAGADLGNHTCSHVDLNKVTADRFESEILSGEAVTTAVLGHRPTYFRYPFLHAGKDIRTKRAVQQFLAKQGYRNAPVTLDDSDYMFASVYAKALAAGNREKAHQVRAIYLTYMESIFEFFERRSIEVTGHEIRQILLIHASQLNADAMPDLLAVMRRRGYSFVPLAHALEDPAYYMAGEYAGPGGFSWIHRWSMTRGMKPKGEPEEPQWIRKEAGF